LLVRAKEEDCLTHPAAAAAAAAAAVGGFLFFCHRLLTNVYNEPTAAAGTILDLFLVWPKLHAMSPF
jgi:hypothetical protein